MDFSRRDLLRRGGTAAACATVWAKASVSEAMVPSNMPLGFQGYEIIPDLEKDWYGTLKAMVAMGYDTIDMIAYGPYLLRSGKELRADFARVGLSCTNCHLDYGNFNST